MNVSAAVGVNSANPVKKSDYECTQEANIARNKQLFHELQEKFGWGDEENDVSERKKEKKKDKKKATQEQTRSSARLAEGVTSPESDSLSAPTPISENKDTNDGGLDSVSQTIEDITPVASTGDIDTISSQPLSSNETDIDFSKASASSDTSPLPQLASSSDPSTSNVITCLTTAATSAESAAQDPHQDVKSTLPPTALTASMLPAPSITTNDPMSMDIGTAKNGTKSTVEADPMQVDGENRQKGESSSVDMAVVALPAWLVTLNMHVYLQGSSDVTAWQGLIGSLYKFEKLNTISGVRCYYFIADCS